MKNILQTSAIAEDSLPAMKRSISTVSSDFSPKTFTRRTVYTYTVRTSWLLKIVFTNPMETGRDVFGSSDLRDVGVDEVPGLFVLILTHFQVPLDGLSHDVPHILKGLPGTLEPRAQLEQIRHQHSHKAGHL